MLFPFTFKYAMLRQVSEIDLAIDNVIIDLVNNDNLRGRIITAIAAENPEKEQQNKLYEIHEYNPLILYKKYFKTQDFKTIEQEIYQKKKDSNFIFPVHEKSNNSYKYLEKLNNNNLAFLSLIKTVKLIDLEEIINRKKQNNTAKFIVQSLYKSIKEEEYQLIKNRMKRYVLSEALTEDISADRLVNSILYDARYNIEKIHDLYYWNDSKILASLTKERFKSNLNIIFVSSILLTHLAIILFLLNHIYWRDIFLSFLLIGAILLLLVYINNFF